MCFTFYTYGSRMLADYVEQSSVIEEHPDVTDEFFDDFDDSSSEGEPTEMNGHADAVNHLVSFTLELLRLRY